MTALLLERETELITATPSTLPESSPSAPPADATPSATSEPDPAPPDSTGDPLATDPSPPTSAGAPSAAVRPESAQAPLDFDLSQHSTTDPDSLWVVVNKSHELATASTYRPALVSVEGYEVARVMAADLRRMLTAARQAGNAIALTSGYRSYRHQERLYRAQVARKGSLAAADRVSARPGFSEHSTGLAIDVDQPRAGCQLLPCFGQTGTGRWVAANGAQFGFIVRYPADKTEITGYGSEPWHLRYVGPALATAMATSSVTTLEEFFGIDGGLYADQR